MSVCCECYVLLRTGLCEDPITRSEESYQVCVCPVVSSCMDKRISFPPSHGAQTPGRPARNDSLYRVRWLVKTDLKFPLWQALRLQSYATPCLS